VVVFDSWPADSNAVLLWREIHEFGSRLLVLANYLHADDATRALIAGCSGIVMVPEARAGSLLEAMMEVASGGCLIPEAPLARLKGIAGDPRRLSEDERAVLARILSGQRNSEISIALEFTEGELNGRVRSLVESLT
jgi:DNA-binding NarL/FixJ family response regulator